MRASALFAGSAAMLAAVVACVSNSSQPPPLGDCTPGDGGTCTPTVVGGGSSGGDAASCAANAGGSQCGLCAGAKCCSELEACTSLMACNNLDSCETDCNGAAACFAACEQQFPTGMETLQLVSSCLSRECPVCAESGVGDPCGPQFAACVVGLTCNGSFCTKPCARSSDCAGLGAAGASSLGLANVCMVTSTGDVCEPTCGAGGGCADFPATYCLSTTAIDGSAVSVCAFLPEASTTD